MKRLGGILLTLLLSSSSWAADESTTALASPTPAPAAIPETQAPEANSTPAPATTPRPVELGRSRDEIAMDQKQEEAKDSVFDRHLTVGALGSVTSFPIPTKYGASVGWRATKWEWEAQYFRGSLGVDTPIVSIGSISESLMIINARRFVGKSSFNWIFGLARQAYDIKLGKDFVASAGIPTSYDVLKVSTVGLQLGLGNRWNVWNGFVLGADWLVINVPFATLQNEAPALDYVNNQDARNKIEDAIKIMRYIPTFTLLKLQAGYSF